MVEIITRYDYEARARVAPRVHFDDKNPSDRSMTKQADKDSADINKIMARFEKTGTLPDTLGIMREPRYGDFTAVKDYHATLSAIRDVERWFGAFPAAFRNRFDNDIQKFINFMEDSKNDEECVKLGLKDQSVLLVALADDGVTRITARERAALDAEAASKEAAGQPAAGASGTGTGS